MTPAHLPERVPCSYGKDVEDLYCCGITSKTQGEVEKKKKKQVGIMNIIYFIICLRKRVYTDTYTTDP